VIFDGLRRFRRVEMRGMAGFDGLEGEKLMQMKLKRELNIVMQNTQLKLDSTGTYFESFDHKPNS
jgi:hypothetical protein